MRRFNLQQSGLRHDDDGERVLPAPFGMMIDNRWFRSAAGYFVQIYDLLHTHVVCDCKDDLVATTASELAEMYRLAQLTREIACRDRVSDQ